MPRPAPAATESCLAGSPERPCLLSTLYWLIDELLWLYTWAVILAAVVSMLTAFNILDTRNRLVWTIGDFLYRLTEPALRPIRRYLPNFGGVDISPIILILLLQALRSLIYHVFQAILSGSVEPLIR